MDKRTGEIFKFESNKWLKEARERNPYLIEVDCNEMCKSLKKVGNQIFCRANRAQRRKIKCVTRKGGNQ